MRKYFVHATSRSFIRIIRIPTYERVAACWIPTSLYGTDYYSRLEKTWHSFHRFIKKMPRKRELCVNPLKTSKFPWANDLQSRSLRQLPGSYSACLNDKIPIACCRVTSANVSCPRTEIAAQRLTDSLFDIADPRSRR